MVLISWDKALITLAAALRLPGWNRIADWNVGIPCNNVKYVSNISWDQDSLLLWLGKRYCQQTPFFSRGEKRKLWELGISNSNCRFGRLIFLAKESLVLLRIGFLTRKGNIGYYMFRRSCFSPHTVLALSIPHFKASFASPFDSAPAIQGKKAACPCYASFWSVGGRVDRPREHRIQQSKFFMQYSLPAGKHALNIFWQAAALLSNLFLFSLPFLSQPADMSVNIGEANQGDAFYRYKMPKLQSRVSTACPLHLGLILPDSTSCDQIHECSAVLSTAWSQQH